MVDHRNRRLEDAQFRILWLLQDNPELSQRELANAAGIGLGGVNFCMKALVEKGLVKLDNFPAAADNRRYACILSPKSISK